MKRIKSTFTSLIVVVLALPVFSHADDVRTSWDNGGTGNDFTNPNNWAAFADPTPPGGNNNQLPGYEVGSPSNAIIQGGWVTGANAPVLNSDFTPVFAFNPLIVRGEAQMTINATLNIGSVDFWTAQTNPNNLVTQNASGTVIARNLYAGLSGGTGTYNMNGGTITLSQSLNNTLTLGSNFNFGVSGNGQDVSLTANSITIDNANNNVFTVGSGSLLKFDGSGSFADGLQVVSSGVLEAAGNLTLGADPNDLLTVDGSSISVGGSSGSEIASLNLGIYDALLTNGATYQYTLNPQLGTEDSFVLDELWLDDTLTVELTQGGALPSELSDSYVLFDFADGGLYQEDGTTPINDTADLLAAVSFNFVGGQFTQIYSTPSVSVVGSSIVLSNLQTVAVPEPSTLLLVVLGSSLLRRRLLKHLQLS